MSWSSWCLKYKHIILQKSTWIVIKTKQHQTNVDVYSSLSVCQPVNQWVTKNTLIFPYFPSLFFSDLNVIWGQGWNYLQLSRQLSSTSQFSTSVEVRLEIVGIGWLVIKSSRVWLIGFLSFCTWSLVMTNDKKWRSPIFVKKSKTIFKINLMLIGFLSFCTWSKLIINVKKWWSPIFIDKSQIFFMGNFMSKNEFLAIFSKEHTVTRKLCGYLHG